MRGIETPDKGLGREGAGGEGGKVFRSAEAAAYLKLTLGTFYTYRSAGKITPDYKYRGKPFYRESSLRRWQAENTEVLAVEA